VGFPERIAGLRYVSTATAMAATPATRYRFEGSIECDGAMIAMQSLTQQRAGLDVWRLPHANRKRRKRCRIRIGDGLGGLRKVIG
jgi:hypothetical protein